MHHQTQHVYLVFPRHGKVTLQFWSQDKEVCAKAATFCQLHIRLSSRKRSIKIDGIHNLLMLLRQVVCKGKGPLDICLCHASPDNCKSQALSPLVRSF